MYQIHRTPFFRRLHRNDSDEFDRLKRAYDCIRNFDQKPLDVKLKKIRIGKLESHIKEILRTSKKPENKFRSKPKNEHQLRCEELAKARQVGNTYSRQNFRPSLSRPVENQKISPNYEWKREMSRLKRRIEYGNLKSQNNRSRIQRSRTMWSQGSQESDAVLPTSTDFSPKKFKQLQPSKNNLKNLVHCLLAEEPHPEVVSSVVEIAKTKNCFYWDLVDAIQKQQLYIERYDTFLEKLSKIGLHNRQKSESDNDLLNSVETYSSKSSIKKTGSSEIYIRTFRYSDDDDFLPPPSESLLRIQNSSESTDGINAYDFVDYSPPVKDTTGLPPVKEAVTNESVPNQRNAFANSSSSNMNSSRNFSNIIRSTVRKESAQMLADLEKALIH